MYKLLFLCCLLVGGITQAQEKSITTYLDEAGELEALEVTPVEEEADSVVIPPKDPPFVRNISAADLKTKKADPAFAYANDPKYWEKKKAVKKNEENFWAFLASDAFRWIIYGVMAIVFLIALYFIIVKQKLSFFSPRSRSSRSMGEEAPLHQSAPDYKLLWKEAEANRDWRMALRYRFLQLLLDLDQKELIRFSPDAPNSLYTRQLAGNIPVTEREETMRAFRQITRVYEYTWYGNLPLEEARYQRSAEQIRSFSKTGAL